MPSKIGTRSPFPPANFALRDAVRETSPAEERSALRPMMINVSYYLELGLKWPKPVGARGNSRDHWEMCR